MRSRNVSVDIIQSSSSPNQGRGDEVSIVQVSMVWQLSVYTVGVSACHPPGCLRANTFQSLAVLISGSKDSEVYRPQSIPRPSSDVHLF